MGVKEEAVLIQEMQYVVENLIYHITEIMVSVILEGSLESVTSICSPETGKIALAFKFEGSTESWRSWVHSHTTGG